MAYTFEILGISPVFSFFTHQQDTLHRKPATGVAYLGSSQCTLDALLAEVESVVPDRPWDLDTAVDTVVRFWLQNADRVHYWKRRLDDAGIQNLLVSRLADVQSLQAEFEGLLERP